MAFGDVDDLVQGEDLQALEALPRPFGVGLIEPATGIQRLELSQGKGTDRAVLALGKALGDIAGTLQVVIVYRHQHAVFAALQVQFEIIRAQLPGQQISRGGGLRRIERCTAMGNHCRVRDALARRQFAALIGCGQPGQGQHQQTGKCADSLQRHDASSSSLAKPA
ncbi:hypothetical protein D3C76_979550 [compost metagenome]